MILIFAILFIASLTRSTFGFGDALIGMPLLAIVAGMQMATPLIQMFGTTIAISILFRQWRQVDLKSTWRLIIASVAGIPIGLFYLKEVNEDIVKTVLALIIILFSIYQITRPRFLRLKNERTALLFGLIGGILGGAYNTNGPPVIFYGTLRGWDPVRFRVTLQGYLLATGGSILIGHALAGLWTPVVIRYYFYSFPVVFAGILLGSYLNKKIRKERFTVYIYILLILLGFLLLIDVLS